MQSRHHIIPTIHLHDACVLNATYHVKPKIKLQSQRDKVSSQGLLAIEPKALIPSCHAPNLIIRRMRGLGKLIQFSY